jgi:alkylation response protein AidB-like acyl-CoA dehydrogenase
MSEENSLPGWLTLLEPIAQTIIAPAAADIDRRSVYPREALTAMGKAGLLGLVSSKDVGGLGLSHRAAAQVIERIARECASTAMVVCMHYCGAVVIEAFGPRAVREAIVRGEHLSTLAFSEAGSRSHFWAPLSTATKAGDGVQLNAKKSWVTSAGQADTYVWSSTPLAAEGASSIWLVPAQAEGLRVDAPFDGIGMRGNLSSPVTAENVIVGKDALLGEDGKGFDVMMGVVLPYFQVMNAACSLGIVEAAMQKTAAHLFNTKLVHLNQALHESPTNRAYSAKAKIKADLLRALLDDTLSALESGHVARAGNQGSSGRNRDGSD